jgi:dihydroneopterin aldolase
LIGVYPQERQAKQAISLDIELSVDTKAAILSDAVEQAVDYAKLVEKVTEWVAVSEFHLVESLADFLARNILLAFPVQRVLLRVRKFTQTVAAESVGVVVERGLSYLPGLTS